MVKFKLYDGIASEFQRASDRMMITLKDGPELLLAMKSSTLNDAVYAGGSLEFGDILKYKVDNLKLNFKKTIQIEVIENLSSYCQ